MRVILYGASSLGLAAYDVAKHVGVEAIVFFDDYATNSPVPGLGLMRRPSDLVHAVEQSEFQVVLCVGEPASRIKIADKIAHMISPESYGSLIHPAAGLMVGSIIDRGCIVLPGANIGPFCSIGSHCVLNANSTFGSRAALGDFCTVASNANIGSESSLGRGCMIGMGACVLPGVELTSHITLGALSLANRSLYERGTFYGCPATRKST